MGKVVETSKLTTYSIDDLTQTLIDYRGKTPRKTEYGIRLITAKVIKSGCIIEGKDEYIAESDYDSWMVRGLPCKDDVLITTEAPLGEVAQILTSEKIALAQRVILLRGKPDKIDQKYYMYALMSSFVQEQLKRFSTGATVAGISQKNLRKVRIPYCELKEQKRIVGILSDRLSAIERARAATAAQLAAAKALPAAYLRQVFDSPEAQKWKRKKLGDVAEIGSGITLGRKLKNASRKVPYLRVANVKDGYLDLTDIYETNATETEIEKCLLKYGDILLTEGGDPDKLGRGKFWEGQVPECIHQNHIFRVRFDLEKFQPQFISFQIGSPYGKRYFLEHAKQTTGIATINKTILSGFPFMVPGVDTQKRITAGLLKKLTESERLQQSLQSQLDTINQLPAALLRQAFNGEL